MPPTHRVVVCSNVTARINQVRAIALRDQGFNAPGPSSADGTRVLWVYPIAHEFPGTIAALSAIPGISLRTHDPVASPHAWEGPTGWVHWSSETRRT